ncbi:MAG: restriction endonuclease subunit S [Candidatus Pacearchaeota archaeon]
MPECFAIYSNEIEGRIDPFYYKPAFIQFYLQLEKTKFEIKSIGEIAEKVTSGATPLSKGNAYTSKEEGIPFIRSGDINEDNNINFDEVLYIKQNIHNKLLKGSKLKKGDILIAIVGATIGQVSIYDCDKEANINQAIALVRLEQGINPEYVKTFMISTLGQKQLDRIKRPVARANINLDEIRSIKIILPPIAIQNKIVALMEKAYQSKKSKEAEAQKLLDSINDYVIDELGIKLPELKDKMIYVVDSNDVEGKRIDAYYYQPKFEEVEKAVKKGKYEVKEIREVLEYYKKGIEVGSDAYVDRGIPFIRVADIDYYKVKYEETDKKIKPELYEQLKDYQPQKDELLFSKDGSVGFCVVVNENKESIISGGILRLKIKEDINNFYIKIILSSKFFKIVTERESIGSIIKHLTPEVFLSMKIPLPPLPIQNKIADEVKRRMQKAEQLQKEAKEELEKAKQEVEKIILG